ncbi:nucleotidyltransferase family protein [Tenacibaculum aiptasiae]|uniref:Nucleotidyltransferase family protein n=1 Tax=Tenacibaculum aiptasiae TaxID=426481 RepID=A0A7J5ACH6_9FLAO|nr:nucleotidyltransferase family protein [Tenacibaculum aiptasiae]KAB1155225.1 nucleotidyltransferase family protein [Tenacibaculum aiptasiae]
MTYKETLFFVGKCLTITHETKNKEIIEKELKSGNIDWDNVVKLSTLHYVFPALYCNLKRANFLHYLPNDLVEYMKHITDLNRERNQQIIEQAKEINELLLENNITPIFLKGTGNLLEGLYEDIAERMVGDIDFIFSKNDYPNAIKVLTKNNYSKVHQTTYDFPSFKHYPRIQKKDKTAAIEIHKEILLEKYADEFNYDIIKNDTLLFNNINVMSYENQLSLSIIAKQINDSGFYFKNIALRNAYDVFLLSKKTNAKNTFNRFEKLKHPLNCFLATCFIVFGEVDSLKFTQTPETKSYISFFKKMLINDPFRKKHLNRTAKKLFIKKRITILFKTFYNSEMRTWFFKRITDKQWYKEKAIQLGLRN